VFRGRSGGDKVMPDDKGDEGPGRWSMHLQSIEFRADNIYTHPSGRRLLFFFLPLLINVGNERETRIPVEEDGN
jgi:hypothetical protein